MQLTIDFHPSTFSAVLIIIFVAYYFQVYRKSNHSFAYLFCILYFMFYILCFIKVAILPINIVNIDIEFGLDRYLQIVPFETIRSVVSNGTWPVQIIGNILLFMPIPFFMELLKNKKFQLKNLIRIMIVLIVSLELIQGLIDLITGFPNKIMDIDDIILNLIGIFLSYFILKILDKTKFYQSIKMSINSKRAKRV